MRRILVLLSFLVTFGLSAAGVINVSPANPQAGKPVTFTLTGVTPLAGSQSWSFGDDSSSSGSSTATHIYASARQYRVRVNFLLAASGSNSAERWITVAPPYTTGPSAPFNVTSLILRWKDGKSITSVAKGFEGLVAYADIKFEGTGPFQAQWLVDGQVMKTVSQTLSFAGRTTIDSGTMPALYTNIPGPHDVTLRILSPVTNFRMPVIRYEVSPVAPTSVPPVVESVYPPTVYSGEEVEVQVTGKNLTEDMKLDFGSGITLVGPITVMSPMSAKVKVFVPPTAKLGFHALSMMKGTDRLVSKARLEVRKRQGGQTPMSGAMPCPDPATLEKGLVKLDQPSWQSKSSDNSITTDMVPTLTDFTVFGWSEAVQGAAGYFELRIYDKTGRNLILTQRLPGGSKQWNTPAGFVPKLVNLVKGGVTTFSAKSIVPMSSAPSGSISGAKTLTSTSLKPMGSLSKTASILKPGLSTPGMATAQKALQGAVLKAQEEAAHAAHLAEISDVLWQIVGLRDYTCLPKQEPMPASGAGQTAGRAASLVPGKPKVVQKPGLPVAVTSQPSMILKPQEPVTSAEAPNPVTVTLEVEASEFWPLKLPDQAKGIVPGSCSVTLPGFSINAVPIEGGASALHYPGDRFELSGDFTLAGSPYGFKPAAIETQAGSQGQQFSTIKGCTFDNVFLDWGDGSMLVPLAPKLKNPDTINSLDSSDVFTLPPGQPYLRHAYEREGAYNVRVFMLSEDDVQLAGLKTDASKAMASKGSLDTKFAKLLNVAAGSLPSGSPAPAEEFTKIGGMQVANSAIAASALQASQPSLQQILSRAYVIYCSTKDIRPFEDPCATKPLELVSLELSFDKGSKGTVGLGAKNLSASVKVGATNAKSPTLTSTPAMTANGLTMPEQGKPQVSASGTSLDAAKSVALKVDAVTSSCNEAFSVRTKVRYQGTGMVKVTWKVDDEVVAVSAPTNLPHTARVGLTKAQSQDKDCVNVPPAEMEINLPDFLPTTTLGVHFLTAEAVVVPSPNMFDLGQVAIDLETLAKGSKDKMTPTTIGLLRAAAKGSDKGTPVKLGVLNPTPSQGMPQVVYLNDVLPAVSRNLNLEVVKGTGNHKPIADLAPLKMPPNFVASQRMTYRVDGADPNEPCSLDFPTKGGPFRVTDLAKNVKTEVVGGVTRMTGQGLVKVAFRKSEDTIDERLALPITLAQWETDGGQVTKGEMNLTNLKKTINLPGTTGTLDSLKGRILGKGKNEDMLARVTLRPSDASLTLRGNEALVPSWTVEKPLGSEGDFYAEDLNLPETYLGRTPWVMSSGGGVVLDYSHAQGQGPAGQGNEWVGVRLKKLKLEPFSFDLVSQSAPFPLVDSWYLGDNGGSSGLFGSVSFKNWEGQFQDGSIKVGTMNFSALGGQNYKANYVDTEVQVPWFPSAIKGNVALSKTAEGYIWAFEDVKAASMPAVVNGGFSLKPANLYFANEKNIAWTVKGDAILDFKADGRPFASFTLDRFCYRFDGRASFEENVRTKTLPLNKKTTLGDTQADIKSVTISMPTSGQSVVDFAFNTTLRLSDSPLLPAADTQVNYRLNKSGAAYSAPPAATAPFELALAFPMGSPTLNGKIRPVYAPGSGGGASTRYTGEVDLGMFGGPPFKTQFVLGYKGNKDYFLCRADIPLGPTGQVLVPELLTLYRIHGGLGYNFGIDAIEGAMGILDAQPDMKGNAIFSAGMRVGSSDGFIYMLDGTMTISTAAAARMKYDAWLLTHDHGGKGQFEGWIQYGSGNFDGKMWGGLNMLGGLVQFSLGNSEANAAVDMHLGSDSWHIYAGQRNGARIKAKVITSESDSYMMLGSQEGLAIGGAQNYYLGVGDSSVASAYAKAYLDMGLQVTPQPKIIGDFGAGMSAGVCVFGVCVSGGVNAAVHAEALPVNVRATANLDLPWPLDDVTFSVHM